MLDKACVHLFRQGDQNIVVDGNSGAVHIVDNSALAMIQLIQKDEALQTTGDLRAHLAQHPDLEDVDSEILELMAEGLLFSPDLTEVPPRPETVVKALCLNVAHDCNLRCEYCFASTGDFGGARELMSLEVAKAAVDFLIKGSKHRQQLEIDFFGGEPLMNWDVVRETVKYGQEEAKKYDKIFRFTITTNGVALTPEITDFINEHMYNVVLSIDGRKKINDKIRHTISGRGSVYEIIVPKYQDLVQKRQGKSYFVRGTFTANNLDFALDVAQLHDLGFTEISMEPVVTDPSEPYALREEHLPGIMAEYDRLAELFLERQKAGQAFNFFHFNVELKKGPCLYKRLSGCGAGYEYLAVAPNGELFPCHQFVGDEKYHLGTVWSGVLNEELPNLFKDSHVLNKPACKACWAKYYCSGGCHKNNMDKEGNPLAPDEITCLMEKKRLECAFYLQAHKFS